jgi:hypothetical protein
MNHPPQDGRSWVESHKKAGPFFGPAFILSPPEGFPGLSLLVVMVVMAMMMMPEAFAGRGLGLRQEQRGANRRQGQNEHDFFHILERVL